MFYDVYTIRNALSIFDFDRDLIKTDDCQAYENTSQFHGYLPTTKECDDSIDDFDRDLIKKDDFHAYGNSSLFH